MLRVCPLFFLCYLVSYLDRVNIGFAKLQMLDDLGLSDTAYAVGASVFFWGYVLFEIPSNVMLRRLGARIWIARIMITWGLVSILMMYIRPLGHLLHLSLSNTLYLLRLLLGICEAGFFPGVIYYLNTWFPAGRQTKIFGGFLVALPVSLLIGGPASGWLMVHMQGVLGLWGWQWLFFMEGLPAVVLGIVVYFVLAENIESAKWLSASEKKELSSEVSREEAFKTSRFAATLKDVRVWILVGVLLTLNTGFYGLSFWLPSILKAAGINEPFHIGLLSTIPWIVALPVMLLNAAHSNRTGERRLHAAVPALIGGLAFILSALCASSPSLSLALLTVAAASVLATFPIYWTFPSQFLAGPAAAAGLAMINSCGNLAGITGALAVNVAKNITGNINSGIYVLGVSLLISGALILCVPGLRHPNVTAD
jgi:MFS family permease